MELINKERLLLPLLGLICISIVLMTAFIGTAINLLVFGIVGFVSVAYVSYKYPRYNFIFILALADFMPLLMKAFKLYEFPVSNAIEGLCLLIFFILIINKRLSGFLTLPGILILVWTGFHFIELANPNATSRVAGLAAIRSLIPLICTFFIAYSSYESKRDVHVYFVGLFVLALITGGYGLYQELIGLPSYDHRWATSSEGLYNLLFTFGRLRKFSFFFSPADFGMFMSLTGVASLIGFFVFTKNSMRIFCGITSVVCLWAMLYTGTRTAMVILAVGFFTFAFITFDRRALITLGFFALVVVGLLLRPSANRSIYVMMTAFSGADDPSMNVRLKNQQLIRSYIQATPFGFGLGSTGWLGTQYSPNTFIGQFPPDSEYVKIAVETGWIGLFVWCVILAILFSYAVNVYFKIHDPEWKSIMAILMSVFFMIIVLQYPQELFRSQVLTMVTASMLGLITKIGTKASAKTL